MKEVFFRVVDKVVVLNNLRYGEIRLKVFYRKWRRRNLCRIFRGGGRREDFRIGF